MQLPNEIDELLWKDILIVWLMSYIPSFTFVKESRHIFATEKTFFF